MLFLTDVFWAFGSIAASILTGFPQGANISLEAGFGRIVFLSAVFVVFHSHTKAP